MLARTPAPLGHSHWIRHLLADEAVDLMLMMPLRRKRSAKYLEKRAAASLSILVPEGDERHLYDPNAGCASRLRVALPSTFPSYAAALVLDPSSESAKKALKELQEPTTD
jgi:hypothetical protein